MSIPCRCDALSDVALRMVGIGTKKCLACDVLLRSLNGYQLCYQVVGKL